MRFKKIVLPMIICLFVLGIFFVFTSSPKQANAQATNPDLIGMRVYKNEEHLTAKEWYMKNVAVSSPQSIIVDGYEAIRDGNTVYVSAAVTHDATNRMFTNIYVLSYTLDSKQATVDIFGRILSKWKFNVSLMDKPTYFGKCEYQATENDTDCVLDSDCSVGYHCTGLKAQVIRDVGRYTTKKELDRILADYIELNGGYPALDAGTYVANMSISVWPSWTNTLGALFGKVLSKDPINYIGSCSDDQADVDTCWNEATDKFNNGGGVPSDALVLVYNGSTGAFSFNRLELQGVYDIFP